MEEYVIYSLDKYLADTPEDEIYDGIFKGWRKVKIKKGKFEEELLFPIIQDFHTGYILTDIGNGFYRFIGHDLYHRQKIRRIKKRTSIKSELKEHTKSITEGNEEMKIPSFLENADVVSLIRGLLGLLILLVIIGTGLLVFSLV